MEHTRIMLRAHLENYVWKSIVKDSKDSKDSKDREILFWNAFDEKNIDENSNLIRIGDESSFEYIRRMRLRTNQLSKKEMDILLGLMINMYIKTLKKMYNGCEGGVGGVGGASDEKSKNNKRIRPEDEIDKGKVIDERTAKITVTIHDISRDPRLYKRIKGY
jgi:hypothetical protein